MGGLFIKSIPFYFSKKKGEKIHLLLFQASRGSNFVGATLKKSPNFIFQKKGK